MVDAVYRQLNYLIETESEVAINLMYLSFNITQEHHITDIKQKAIVIKNIIDNINLGYKTLILNGAHEHRGIEPLMVAILNLIAIPNDKIKLVLSIPTDNLILTKYNLQIIPSASANMFNFYGKIKEQNILWKDIPLLSHFIVLANNTTIERAEIIKSILDIEKSKVRASFGATFRNSLSDSQLEYWKKIMHPYPMPLTIDKEYFSDYHDINSPSYTLYQSLVNVVLESLLPTNPYTDLSEKSYKPFAWRQMPLWFAPAGQVDVVRKLGFDTFDDFFNGHKYNLETNIQLYKLKLLQTIKNFAQKYPSLDDIKILRNSIWNRIDDNEKHLAKIIENNPYYLQA